MNRVGRNQRSPGNTNFVGRRGSERYQGRVTFVDEIISREELSALGLVHQRTESRERNSFQTPPCLESSTLGSTNRRREC